MANDPPSEEAEDPTVDAMEVEDSEEKARQEADAMNYNAVVSELETKHAKLQEEHETCKGQLDLQTAELNESKKQIMALNEEKVQLEQQLALAKREAQSGNADHQSLEQEHKAFKERMDRKDAEADALREEIR